MSLKSGWEDALSQAKDVKRTLDDQERRLKALGDDPTAQRLLKDVQRDQKEITAEINKIESKLSAFC